MSREAVKARVAELTYQHALTPKAKLIEIIANAEDIIAGLQKCMVDLVLPPLPNIT